MNAAPLLVSFNSIEKYLEALSKPNRDKHGSELTKLYELSLPPVTSPYCLSVLFGYSLKFTYRILTEQQKFYRTFDIRQRNKRRQINSPKVALKVIQKWIAHHLDETTEFSPHIYGFIKDRSFIDAAKQHIGSKWVYSIDIKDFFQSITEENVATLFADIGYQMESSDILAKLCCLNKKLAQGSPASPVISNIYMRDIDKKLFDLRAKYKIIVTRYADDIVFSGNNEFNDQLKHEVENIFLNSELSLNFDKTYFTESNKGQRLKVHGLLIKDNRVTLTKRHRNKIRAYRHMLNTGNINEIDKPRILGHINFAELIEREGNL